MLSAPRLIHGQAPLDERAHLDSAIDKVIPYDRTRLNLSNHSECSKGEKLDVLAPTARLTDGGGDGGHEGCQAGNGEVMRKAS